MRLLLTLSTKAAKTYRVIAKNREMSNRENGGIIGSKKRGEVVSV
jgi:hypothetical protein